MTSSFPFLAFAKASESTSALVADLENGDYKKVLLSEAAQKLLPELHHVRDAENAAQALKDLLKQRLTDPALQETAIILGLALLNSFLQTNVTGPILDFDSFSLCFQSTSDHDTQSRRPVRQALLRALQIDGLSAYVLTPQIELFWIAKELITTEDTVVASDAAAWARIRVNFWHQKLLSEPADTLKDELYRDLVVLEGFVFGTSSSYTDKAKAALLIERATIRTFYDADKKAREDLTEAARLRKFQYVLTGKLGRRTKFQQFDTSQLVVLAKSDTGTTDEGENGIASAPPTEIGEAEPSAPKHVDLEDDTLLEKISFVEDNANGDAAAEPQVPAALKDLDPDPAKQPALASEDCAILLAYSSSITNEVPDHGLTREETLPYASRVYQGSSTNWEVYSQALLVRSRIECHKARTNTRGLLQLQALVDQVIVDTGGAPKDQTASNGDNAGNDTAVTNFLPKPKASESAPAVERLRYLHLLAAPPRWALEGELAAQWAEQGGLRTALEIYSRLEMWAEAALCLAATEQEAKANRMVRRQLYETGPPPDAYAFPSPDAAEIAASAPADEQFYGPERAHLADAPRLLCILGDLETNPAHYARAWTLSGQRYARAQRKLGRYFAKRGDLAAADAAYTLALRAAQLDGPTWFAVGCVRLQTSSWSGAVAAFRRFVQLEHDDAEGWSNLGAALLRLPADEDAKGVEVTGDGASTEAQDPQRHVRAAFAAFKRAAALKRDSYRIWQNVLNTGLDVSPPPYVDLLVAQRRLIELRGGTEGESCVDAPVLEAIMRRIVVEAEHTEPAPDSQPRRGLEKMFADVVRNHVVPIITRSRRLWLLVARLEIHLRRPAAALDAYEKAWRAVLNTPGWDEGSANQAKGADSAWTEVQDATDELVDAYESLGQREATEGLKAGTGELVCANWRFKARTAVRSVVGRRTKAGFDDVDRLKTRMEELKG